MLVPLPEAYGALRAAPACPASIPSAAAPRTTTGSLNATVMLMIAPAVYVSLAFGDDAETAAGRAASISMSFRSPSDLPDPGAGSVRLAAAPVAASRIAPLPDRAPAPAWSRSAVLSPRATV